MPTEADHIALANRNHDALEHLLSDPSRYSEWVATTAFYKAVQVVEAMFTRAGKPTHDHSSRHDALKIAHPEIWKHYRVLWQASCIARYLSDKSTRTRYSRFSDYIAPEQLQPKLINKRLRPVEQLAVSHLSEHERGALRRVPS